MLGDYCEMSVHNCSELKYLHGVHFSDQLVSIRSLFLLGFQLLVALENVLLHASIPLSDDSLDRCKFARALLNAHFE